MHLRITILIIPILFSSCHFFSSVKYGKALSEKDEKSHIYTYSINEGLKFNYPDEYIEDCLFQIFTDKNIEFDFEKQAYRDNDNILLTLKDKDGQQFIYKIACYNAISSNNRLDSLLLSPKYKSPFKSYLSIITVTDKDKNILNIATENNKKFPNSNLYLKLDSLFKADIEYPLLKKLIENKFKSCNDEMGQTEQNGVYKLLLSDTCNNKPLAIYTYIKKEQGEKDNYLVKIEKFYTNFILVDSLNSSTKISKYLIYKTGELKNIY